MSDRQEAAYRVLDQLQRTFCFFKLSKWRFFDPVQFVEACRSLHLNFNVYHQNDAAEFSDQLLDRIETVTKGKHTQRDAWNNTFMSSFSDSYRYSATIDDAWNNTFMSHVFGGKWLYQKIPKDCEAYDHVKETCGHWQSSRQESFLKVELIIRGKDKIEDSLGELIQGELMDGDNKIQCDVCTQKKATTRRTCFGHLPNTMILHLKRFDLDFQTFETVKLNNRMAFPLRINMFEYTKEGIEQLERKKLVEAGGGGVEGEDDDEMSMVPADAWTTKQTI
jgi:ubiquitin carboxyl-terminal hydrolase 9/24